MQYWYGVRTLFKDMECIQAERAGVMAANERPETSVFGFDDAGAHYEGYLTWFSNHKRADAEVEWCLQTDIWNMKPYPQGI